MRHSTFSSHGDLGRRLNFAVPAQYKMLFGYSGLKCIAADFDLLFSQIDVANLAYQRRSLVQIETYEVLYFLTRERRLFHVNKQRT